MARFGGQLFAVVVVADTIVWLAVATEAGKYHGKLFLDREVRTTHLFSNTREDESERRKLMDLLMDQVGTAI